MKILTEQLEEARMSAFENEICNYAWKNASLEDKEISNILVPISDLSIHLEEKVDESLQWIASAAARLIGYFHHMNNDEQIFNAGGRWLTKKEKAFWLSLNQSEKDSLTRVSQNQNNELTEKELLCLCHIYSKYGA